MADSGFQDVDHVLTTREFARMLRQAGIDLSTLPEGEYDDPLGTSTGAAVIFGATGGVMEAALRTVYEVVTAKTLEQLDFEAARGLDGIREVTASLNGMTLRAAIANGLGNVRKIMERVRSGEADYHFIEMMACPGGCLAGGGQPIPIDHGVREKRASALYRADREMPLRKSHENPVVKQIYEEYFEEPLSHRGHELLHTHYESRSPAEASGAEVGRRAVAEPQRSA